MPPVGRRSDVESFRNFDPVFLGEFASPNRSMNSMPEMQSGHVFDGTTDIFSCFPQGDLNNPNVLSNLDTRVDIHGFHAGQSDLGHSGRDILSPPFLSPDFDSDHATTINNADQDSNLFQALYAPSSCHGTFDTTSSRSGAQSNDTLTGPMVDTQVFDRMRFILHKRQERHTWEEIGRLHNERFGSAASSGALKHM